MLCYGLLVSVLGAQSAWCPNPVIGGPVSPPAPPPMHSATEPPYHNISNRYWHCPLSRVYVTVEGPSVCLPHRSTAAAVACGFAAERRVGSCRHRAPAATRRAQQQRRGSKCAQCRFDSRRTTLDEDLFVVFTVVGEEWDGHVSRLIRLLLCPRLQRLIQIWNLITGNLIRQLSTERSTASYAVYRAYPSPDIPPPQDVCRSVKKR